MKTVFFDIDSQLDFLYPAGALYVPGGEKVVPAIAKLNRFAAAHGIPVISTTDAHTEDDPEFKSWPHHCVAGTLGQRKAEATLLDGRVIIPNREHKPAIEDARQIILEKQTLDAFATATLHPILARLKPERAIVYGVVTEICVLHAARGLLRGGHSVTVVADAVECLDTGNSEDALREIREAGGTVSTLSEICAQ